MIIILLIHSVHKSLRFILFWGENYTFGAGGRGDADLIRRLAGELNYRALVVAPVMDGSVVASSTYVRALLAAGETAHAHRLLDIPVTRG